MTKGIDRSEIKKTIAEFKQAVEELGKTLPPTSKVFETLHKLLGQLFRLVESEDRLAEKANKTDFEAIERQFSHLRVKFERIERETQGPTKEDFKELGQELQRLNKALLGRLETCEKQQDILGEEIARFQPQVLALTSYFDTYLRLEQKKAALVLCHLSEEDFQATINLAKEERGKQALTPEARNQRLAQMVTNTVLTIAKIAQEHPEQLANFSALSVPKEAVES